MSAKLNLVIDQGSTFSATFDVKDDSGNAIDLSNYTANSQIRKHYTSTSYTPFTVSANSSGSIVLSLNANTTSSLTPGRYVYDVVIVSNTSVHTRVAEGIATVTPRVTK